MLPSVSTLSLSTTVSALSLPCYRTDGTYWWTGVQLYLATDQLVSDGGWGGLGTSSSPSLFTSSTVTLSADVTIVGLILNVRDNTLPAETNLTAEIFTSPCGFTDPVGTGITATITGSSNAETPNYLAIGTGSVGVTQDSLLSVRLTTSQGVGF